jgi:hypothetical protein
MAVSSSSYSPLTYNGNGATTAFSVTFPFFTGSLVVTAVDADGVETTKTITTHYTVAGGTDGNGLPATGTVTMLTAPASGTTLRIARSTTKTQALALTNNDPFPAKSIEAAFDKAILISQENGSGGGTAYDEITGDVLSLNSSGATDYWDAEDHIIRNVADGSEDDDAATYGQLTTAVAAVSTGSTYFTQLGTGATERTWLAKLRERISPMDFGAVGDGATDDKAAIQLAINYAGTLGTEDTAVIVDLCGLDYAISGTLNVIDFPGVWISNGGLTAIGAGWSASDPAISFVNTATKRNQGVSNLVIDCATKCSGLSFNRAQLANAKTVHIQHCVTFGLKLGTTTSGGFCADDVRVDEWYFGEAGELDRALRTSTGFDMGHSDYLMSNCKAAYCLYGLAVGSAAYNGLHTNCHFFAGTSGVGADGDVVVSYAGFNGVFTACNFDNGAVLISNPNIAIMGCNFIKNAYGYNDDAVRLTTSTASDEADDVLICNNYFTDNITDQFTFETTGAGSWASTLKCAIYNNRRETGKTVTGYGTVTFPAGTATRPGVHFTNGDGLYLIATNEIGLALNFTGEVKWTTAAYSPVTNDGNALGTTALGWADLHGATGFTWNIANGNAVVTHSSGVFTVSTGDWRITTAGTNAASAVTVGGTQTLTDKTLTAPKLTSTVVASLPAGAAGMLAFASNGRKNGEGAGVGTGVLVFHDGTNWIACDTGATVAA